MSRILIFGASITYGKWDLKGGWVQRLRNYIDEKSLSDPNFDYSIYNLGVSGDTTEDLLKRFELETKRRFWEEKEIIIMFQIGINDSQVVFGKNESRTSAQKFQDNIQKLIELSRKFSSKIIFIELPPVDESKVDPIPWYPKYSYKNEYIKSFNEIIKSLCEKNKIYFVEVFKKWRSGDYKTLLQDGVHPNSEGHEKIFETVKNFLIKNKIVPID